MVAQPLRDGLDHRRRHALFQREDIRIELGEDAREVVDVGVAAETAQRLERLARRIALQALDVLGWAKCCLLGHSLGGAVSTLLAVVAPERVTAVSLIDQIGPLSEAPDQFPARLKRSIEAHAATAVQEPPEYPTLEDLIERRRRAGGIGDQGARLLVTRNARRTETGYRWGSDSRLRLPAPLYLDEAQARAILMTIKCPVQMIMASDGLIAARANTLGRIEAMTTLTVEKMTGGHHLHMDNPGSVAHDIVPFLQSHVPADD